MTSNGVVESQDDMSAEDYRIVQSDEEYAGPCDCGYCQDANRMLDKLNEIDEIENEHSVGVRGRGNLEHRQQIAKHGKGHNFDWIDIEGFSYKKLPRADKYKSKAKGR